MQKNSKNKKKINSKILKKNAHPFFLHEGPCPYFPDQLNSQSAYALANQLDPQTLQVAMDLGIRRSGPALYRPLCPNCRRCLSTRININNFSLSSSQDKISKKIENSIEISIQKPTLDQERIDLFKDYIGFQHSSHNQFPVTVHSYQRFLIDTCAETIEISWRLLNKKLVGISILDICDNGLSSIYFYWHKSLKKYSLGIFSILKEIEITKNMGLDYYYLGYLIRGCPQMEYKNQFSGLEILSGKNWLALKRQNISNSHWLRQQEKTMKSEDDKNFS